MTLLPAINGLPGISLKESIGQFPSPQEFSSLIMYMKREMVPNDFIKPLMAKERTANPLKSSNPLIV